MGEVATLTNQVDELFREVWRVANTCQPELVVSMEDDVVLVEGKFVVWDGQGPLDGYSVFIGFFSDFPSTSPRVYETEGRIPRDLDRHVFPSDGACCLTVWEGWLAEVQEPTVEAFFRGPLHDFFFSQTYFDTNGEWPFGERSHGITGVVEAFSEILGVEQDRQVVIAYLRLMCRQHLGGHAICPCGSSKRLRDCHRGEVEVLRGRISRDMARRMLRQVETRNRSKKNL
ncbi:hypothetical protein DSD19_09000 [Rhodovulum sp. BSW8]|uniref:hypothetical protein n=1 Tax=Rhodovulum sp. BSW8 TaxID=2259645 RepID=UPI000DE3AD90|nr:hypothetical protein [Rhodovulum sp. BSW8]RBO53510.1 hypothetical protein DSD19_09000 [Rhodovulum sp. BSW8]